MDRELDASYRYRRLGRRMAVVGPILALCVAILVLLPGWLRPSVARERIRTAVVERGPVEASVEASGTVIPAFESVLSSPLETRVEKILKRAGDPLRPGEGILQLDTSAFQLDLARLEDRLEQKRNEQRQLQISLDKDLVELRGQIETQRLDVEVLDARVDQNRKLNAEGLVSQEALRVSEVEAKKAKIQLRQYEERVASSRRTADAQLQGLTLDLQLLDRELAESRRQLDLATTRSDRAGVLTWVLPEEGAMVRRGEVIARIADLDSFRVEATVSDVHAARLSPGQTVQVILDGQPLAGRLASIDPTIENGTVKFAVDLEDNDHPKLRNNLRVDVLVVTGSRKDALRVRKGPFTEGGSDQVFVIAGQEAVRRPVRFGLAGHEFLEVRDGLREGDEVIVSDMSDYIHLNQVNLK